MCKKLMFLISLVLLLGLVSNASAGDVTWTNEYPWSMLWLSAANWDPVGVPGPGDTAIVSPQFVDPLAPAVYPGQGPVIDANVHVNQIKGPRKDSDDDQIMLVLAGDVQVNGNWEVGESGAGTATLEISGGDVEVGDRLYVAQRGTGIVDIKGDAIVSVGNMENGVREDATGTLNIGENADFSVRNNFEDFGRDDSTWAINVSGYASCDFDGEAKIGSGDGVGVFNVTDDAYLHGNDEFEIANDDSAYADITFDVNALVELDDRLRLNGNGTLLITDDAILILDGFMKMADEDSSCYVTVTFNGNAQVDVLDEDNDMGFWFGDDGTGEMNIGDNADVYFAERVCIPDSGLAASLTMSGNSQLEIDNDLRIPSAGSCVFEISDNALLICDEFDVGRDAGTLAAMDGGRVDCEDFEHTTNYFMDFTLGELLIDGNDQPLYQDIYGEILAGRITGYGGCGGRGDIHIDQFSIPDHTLVYASSNPYRAWNPDPTCDAVDQPPIVTLDWNAGDDADVHHIFLSTNFDCVNEGILVCWLDSQPDPDTDIVTPELTLGATYYWRVEEVDTDPPGRVTAGQAWQFTVQANMPVDGGDMEDFDEENPIWDTWQDGCGDANGEGKNNTGSCLYVVAQSDQAMQYYYDNTGQDYFYTTRDCNYSEAVNVFDAPQDWTLYGIEAIELMFSGDPGNDNGPDEAMYMVLTDASSGEGVVVYGAKEPEDLDDMLVAEWQQWDIDLDEFGIDLTAVTSIAIGFGDRTNCHDRMGGIGVMLIDDIALYPERCVPKYTPDIHDLNDDCVTDMKDVKIQADDYLHDER
ncbi:MAG: hypothetical protein ACYS83_03845 [Planctomycetota bacterium]|jgi:hypothetical protein